ncbi:hypothetical protein [Rhizobium leguminosarum]|uniref:hypothetical protein n=1 Tax=Rhizobium leguminosarum TaxID=384 RepID=UPI0013E2E631|nr:hypothetical protein [Rhizobium leguminosarum]
MVSPVSLACQCEHIIEAAQATKLWRGRAEFSAISEPDHVAASRGDDFDVRDRPGLANGIGSMDLGLHDVGAVLVFEFDFKTPAELVNGNQRSVQKPCEALARNTKDNSRTQPVFARLVPIFAILGVIASMLSAMVIITSALAATIIRRVVLAATMTMIAVAGLVAAAAAALIVTAGITAATAATVVIAT